MLNNEFCFKILKKALNSFTLRNNCITCLEIVVSLTFNFVNLKKFSFENQTLFSSS